MGMREKLIEVMKDTRANAAWHKWNYEESADYMIANGVTIPVRCKECKCRHEETGFCEEHSRFDSFGMDWNMFAEDDFCSYGERKTE